MWSRTRRNGGGIVQLGDGEGLCRRSSATNNAPIPGTYNGGLQLAITDPLPGAVIDYTTGGSTPTTNSALYIEVIMANPAFPTN